MVFLLLVCLHFFNLNYKYRYLLPQLHLGIATMSAQCMIKTKTGADRHLDIGLQVVEAHPLFPYFLEKHLAIPTFPFIITIYHLLVNGFSVTRLPPFFKI